MWWPSPARFTVVSLRAIKSLKKYKHNKTTRGASFHFMQNTSLESNCCVTKVQRNPQLLLVSFGVVSRVIKRATLVINLGWRCLETNLPTHPLFQAPIPAQIIWQPRMQPRKHFSQAPPHIKISKHFFQAADASTFPSSASNQMPAKKIFWSMRLSGPGLELHLAISNQHSKQVPKNCQGTKIFHAEGICNMFQVPHVPMKRLVGLNSPVWGVTNP